MPHYYYKDFNTILKPALTPSREDPRKKRKHVFFLLIIVFLSFLSVFINSSSRQPEPSTGYTPLQEVLNKFTFISPIQRIAEKELSISKHDFGIVILNLKTGENYYHNENKKFNAGSLYKLWVMAVAFQKIKDGSLSENEELVGNLNVLKETLEIPIPTVSGEPQDREKTEEEKKAEEVKMTVGPAITKMITISDNYAAVLVASRSGSANVFKFLKESGFSDSSFRQPPITTPSDIALFYEKLYKGEIVDRTYSDRMLEILKGQVLNDRIPKYLPEDVEVAHKTGELGKFKHDAGIVFSKKGDYIIVVLSESETPLVTAENIAKFSEEVYKYFES